MEVGFEAVFSEGVVKGATASATVLAHKEDE